MKSLFAFFEIFSSLTFLQTVKLENSRRDG